MHILGINNLGKSTNQDNCCFQESWSSAQIYPSKSIPARGCDISFNCSFHGSQKPQGLYNSARIETTIRRVRIALFMRRPASSKVTTGKTLDFFAPQIFLFKIGKSRVQNILFRIPLVPKQFHMYSIRTSLFSRCCSTIDYVLEAKTSLL